MKRNILCVFALAFLVLNCSKKDPAVERTPEEEVVPDAELPPEEEEPSPCEEPVGDYDAKPSDFEISSTVGDKFIRNMTDQVQAALDTCGEGGVVWLEDKVWLIDRNLVPKFNNTKITGGTLKRADAITSALTAAVKVGDSVLNVENSDNFYPGLILSVTDGNTFGDTMYPRVFVATVTPGQITLGSAVTKDFEPGAVVFNVSNLINIGRDTVDNTVISKVVFDGNEANNNYTYDWRLNSALAMSGSNQLVECSSFINSPCESMIGHNVTVRNTTGENLFGSFFHCSGYQSGTILIENCTTNNTNMASLEQGGHNEGTITLSDNSGNLTIKDSEFKLGGQAAWGLIGEDDCLITATNTTFSDHAKRYFRGDFPSDPCFDDSDVTYTNTPDE